MSLQFGSTRAWRTNSMKIDIILCELMKFNWTLADFLYHLFADEMRYGKPVQREQRHQQMVNALLNGASARTFVSILDLVYKNAARTPYRANDTTAPSGSVVPGLDPAQIAHAHPGLNMWAIRIVADLVRDEAKEVIKPEHGLHLPAGGRVLRPSGDVNAGGEVAEATGEDEQTRRRRGGRQPVAREAVVTWKKLNSFSFRGMQESFTKHAPVMWYITNVYANPLHGTSVVAVRKYRPQMTVSIRRTMIQSLS